MSGNEYLVMCAGWKAGHLDTQGNMDEGFRCIGFVQGWYQELLLLSNIDPKTVCIIRPPDGVTYGQIIDIVSAYIVNHPATRHELAVGLANEAMVAAFPCK